MLNDLTAILTDPLLGTLDALVPLVRLLRAAVNAVAPEQCVGAAHGMVDLNLVQLVLGMASVR